MAENHDIDAIEKILSSSLDHWHNVSQQMLALHQQDAEQCSVRIEALVDDNHL